MNSFAVIETGGKQYRVSAGQKVKIEKVSVAAGGNLVFDKVLLLVNGDKMEIGTPHIAGAKVHGNVLRQARDRKKIVFKYHSKTRYRKKKGHRQPFTEVEITKI
ncbi:MAG: 50S ribosomal protein L21 [Candidatus Liptonbacteria bacterium]|nr:50S ribosomal protein L21 [Candidatus Liptonbacteria bacterium]